MSVAKLTGRVTTFVFALFGFTTLYDHFSKSETALVSPIIGWTMIIVALVAYWVTRKK